MSGPLTGKHSRQTEDGSQSASFDTVRATPPILSGEWGPAAFVSVIEKLEARPAVAYVLVSDGLSEKCVFFPAGGLRMTSLGVRRSVALSAALRAHPKFQREWESVLRQAADDPDHGLEELADGDLREAYKEVSARIVQDELLDLVVWNGADFEYRENNPPPVIFDPELEAVKLSLGVKVQLARVQKWVTEWRKLQRSVGDPRLSIVHLRPGIEATRPLRVAFERLLKAGQQKPTLDEVLVLARRAGGLAPPLLKEIADLAAKHALKLEPSPPPRPPRIRRQRAQDNVKEIEAALAKLINRLAAHRRLAEEYSTLGDQDAAVEHMRIVGEELNLREDWEGALGVYHKILELSPRAFFAREELALMLERLGRGPEALKEWLRMARELAQAKLFNRAQDRLRQAIRLQPEEPSLYRYLIDCLLARGAKKEAAEVYEDLGNLYKKKGMADEAAACFQKVVELLPKGSPKREKARGELAGVTKTRPPSPKALAGLAVAFALLIGVALFVQQRHASLQGMLQVREEAIQLAQRGDYASARSQIDDFLGLNPRFEDALGEGRDAIAALEAQEAGALLLRAARLEKAGDPRAARALYNDLSERFKGTAAAAKAKQRLEAFAALEAEARAAVVEIEAHLDQGRVDPALAASAALLASHGWTDVVRGFEVPLRVTSQPSGAQVLLAGALRDGKTPTLVRAPWLKPIPLELRAEGYTPAKLELDARALEGLTLAQTLQKQTRWRRSTRGPIVTPIYLAEGRMLVLSSDQCLYSLGQGGRLAWRAPKGPVDDRLGLFREVQGAPLRVDGLAFVGEARGRVQVVSVESGELRPHLEVPGEGRLVALGASANRAVFLRGKTLRAFDRKGDVAWTTTLPAAGLRGAVDLKGQRALICLEQPAGLIVVDLVKGKPYRPFPLEAAPAGLPAPAPGGVLVGSGQDLVLRWSQEVWRAKLPAPLKGAPTTDARRVYVSAGAAICAFDLATGKPAWTRDFGEPVGAPLRGVGLYVATRSGRVEALDPESGKTRWVFECAGEIRVPLTLSRRTIFAASTDGTLYAIED